MASGIVKLFALSDQQYIPHARPTYSQLVKYLVYDAALLQLCRLQSSTTQHSTINCKICPLIVSLNICVLTVLTTLGKCSEFFSSSFWYRSGPFRYHASLFRYHYTRTFHSGIIPVHSGLFWYHSVSFQYNSGLFLYHSGSFRYHSGLIPVYSGIIPVHSRSFRLILLRSCV